MSIDGDLNQAMEKEIIDGSAASYLVLLLKPNSFLGKVLLAAVLAYGHTFISLLFIQKLDWALNFLEKNLGYKLQRLENDVKPPPITDLQWQNGMRNGWATLFPIHLWIVFSGMLHRITLDWRINIIELAVVSILLLVLIDTYFYHVHKLMHRNKTLYTLCHAHHHRNIALNMFTLVDVDIWDLPVTFTPIFWFFTYCMAWTGNFHVITYVVAYYWALGALALGHSGYTNIDVFHISPVVNRFVDHELHHRDARYNFSAFFTFWDKFYGTYCPFEELKVLPASMLQNKQEQEQEKLKEREQEQEQEKLKEREQEQESIKESEKKLD